MYFTQQEYVPRLVRSSYILAVGYVAGYVMGVKNNDAQAQTYIDNIDDYNFLALECSFTKGSLTNVTIKVEFSDDNSTWYIPSKTTFSANVGTPAPALWTLTADGNYYININADLFNGGPFKTKYIRISPSGVGTITNSALAITAVLGVA